MCGIFGIVNENIAPEKAEFCLNRLMHRGPDGGDLWREDGICFGHRRLAILDLSENGRQPMTVGDGRYEMVFNGEIYNFIEVRKELEALGDTFVGESDSEVLLAAYIRWGKDAFTRFNGMWACAIWDRLQKTLFLSRDRFGVKPLYYTYLDSAKTKLAFASEMKALMPLMEKVTPNRAIVCDPVRMVYYESTEECVINGIYRFPAACHGTFDPSQSDWGVVITKYYNTLDHLMKLPSSYEEQVEMCRAIFLDACKIRMRSDVTIGTALSGGLDSSATICAMAHLAKEGTTDRMSNDWQHAFVATFPGTALDESVYAKTVTDYLQIPATFVEIDPCASIDKLEEYIYKLEDVYLTSPIPMMRLYGALRENGTIVTIDGHGADELFGGYTFDFVNALADAHTREERDMVMTAYIESFPKDGSNMSLSMPTPMGVKLSMAKKKLYDLKNHKTQAYKAVRAAGDLRYKKMDHLNKILYASSHETILPTLLRNYDRYSMAASVEIRMPFMDYRMVELAMSLPWTSKLHGGFSKSIIRDACAPFMPGSIAYRRTKIGFNTPIVEWMQGPLREYFTDMVGSTDFANCDLIEAQNVRAMVENVIHNEKATFLDGEKAFSALYPYLWSKAFLHSDNHA